MGLFSKKKEVVETKKEEVIPETKLNNETEEFVIEDTMSISKNGKNLNSSKVPKQKPSLKELKQEDEPESFEDDLIQLVSKYVENNDDYLQIIGIMDKVKHELLHTLDSEEESE